MEVETKKKESKMPTLTADSMVARAILAANRPVKFGGAPAHADRMSRHETLDVWYDIQHAFLIEIGCVAMRAATDEGRFCWLVRRNGHDDVLSYVKSPYDVLPEGGGDDSGAQVPHPAVTELAMSLRRGEIRIRLAPSDFRGAGRPLRLVTRFGMPGWLAAWLMPFVPQLGRAIWAGHRRTLESRQIWLCARRLAKTPSYLASA